VLSHAGFIHYPSEWLHRPFGGRYCAVMHDESHAICGPVEENLLSEAAR